MSKRWSYAVLVVAMGCGNTPITNVPFDVQVGSDVPGQDVVDAGGGGQDVVDAGGARPDVVDGGSRADVVDAATGADVVDAGGGMDVVDAGAPDTGTPDVAPATDVVDAGTPDVPRVSVGCVTPLGTITLPGTPAPITNTLRGMSMQPSTGCRPDAPGPEDVYNLTVTTRTGVVLSTEAMGTTFDTLVSIRRTCTDVATEVACDDDGSLTTAQSITRAVLEPGTYSVLVEGYSGATGTYVLSGSTYTPAANAVCATPTVLAPGAMVAGDLAGSGATRSICGRTTDSGVLYYSVTVPATSRVNLTVTPVVPDGGTTFTPTVRVVDSCDATACSVATTGTGAVPVINASNAPRTFIVMVARTFWDNAGAFSLSASAPMAVVEGTDCAVPRTVTPGMDLTAQDTAIGISPNTTCVTGSTGNQLFYQVTIPAGQYARVSATSTGMTARAPVVRALTGCPATACEDFNTGTTTTDGVAFIANAGTTPRTAVFSVSSTGSTTPGTFTVRAALSPITGMGTTCAAPVALASGVAANGNSGNGFQPNRVCSATETGPQSFYSVTIPARQRSRIVVTPAMGAMYTARLRVLDSCTATTCAASPVATTAGGAVETTVNNDTDMPRSVIVSVAATTTMTPGAYTITATNAPIPGYTASVITSACDDLSMGATAIQPSGGWDDDDATAIAALPFTVQYFGAPATHFSVTSNGFMQLWPSMTGSPSVAAGNGAIPGTSTPNGVVAPFWDDLLAVAMRTGVRTATLGTGTTRRFVVEWTGWDTYTSTMANLTFQAKLFETTNVIEFHYCSMMGSDPRVGGSSATVGIEDTTGTLASQVSNNTAGSVVPAMGRRFTAR